MKKNVKWILLAVLLVLLMVAASGLYNSLKDKVELSNLAVQATTAPAETAAAPEVTAVPTATPQPAPDFTVVDGEGNEGSLSSFRGSRRW